MNFLSKIDALPSDKTFTKEDLLTEQFLLNKDRDLEIYYSPHNEFINTEAKIAIVGITPGWTQMKTAFQEAKLRVSEGMEDIQIFKEVKMAASFSGQMRRNLISMLDDCGIAEAVELDASSSLFHDNRSLLHTTSVIKHPAFYRNKNYTGHIPKISSSSVLSAYAFNCFPNELEKLKHQLLVIPLGKAAEAVITDLANKQKLPNHFYMYGFPHPSGANGHRFSQLQSNMRQLKEIIEKWKRTL
ncbi:Uracil DNA glycosylase superfamily protein [Bacillus sp. OV322]|uniref:hypothetical protein n=1 Tax=Bacillus sp. OV322 TaxID=1882764 RepID=UPI0008F2222A|nr:hypothetical protein [Bacillus sp. OV322]SFC71781.1 Uracil DNA glycosylase superfamily protein [Bacillus sp. OV322]